MDNKITLKVATPAGLYEGTFEVTDKVQYVIAAIVKAMSLPQGDEFELALDGKSLAPDKPLLVFKLHDGTVLDLIATGSGV